MTISRTQARIIVVLLFLIAASVMTMALTDVGPGESLNLRNSSSTEEAEEESTTTTTEEIVTTTTTVAVPVTTISYVDPVTGQTVVVNNISEVPEGVEPIIVTSNPSEDPTEVPEPADEPEPTTTTTEYVPPPTTTTTAPPPVYQHHIVVYLDGALTHSVSMSAFCVDDTRSAEKQFSVSRTMSGGQVMEDWIENTLDPVLECYVQWTPYGPDDRVDFILSGLAEVTATL